MKFGETFTEYLEAHKEEIVIDCHIEYKRLKKVLKTCAKCRATPAAAIDRHKDEEEEEEAEEEEAEEEEEEEEEEDDSIRCPCCDEKFFSELMKEASEIVGCFSSRVRRLLQFHVNNNGMQKYLMNIRRCCFATPPKPTAEECRLLIEYVAMNAVAMRKILKKYDKVHSSVNGRKFRSKIQEEHLEILQSPWLIELGAFYMNIRSADSRDNNPSFVAFDLEATEQPKMSLILPDSAKLEYDLKCAICLELVFWPYALGCGHLFCNSCICNAASVLIRDGPKAASHKSKCPICREAGVYQNAVHMIELELLMKKQCREYWSERLAKERAEILKQEQAYWEQQTKNMIGY